MQHTMANETQEVGGNIEAKNTLAHRKISKRNDSQNELRSPFISHWVLGGEERWRRTLQEIAFLVPDRLRYVLLASLRPDALKKLASV